jgi:hypothetical protein
MERVYVMHDGFTSPHPGAPDNACIWMQYDWAQVSTVAIFGTLSARFRQAAFTILPFAACTTSSLKVATFSCLLSLVQCPFVVFVTRGDEKNTIAEVD